MAKRKKQKKLTSKGANKIALLISSIIFIGSIVLYIVLFNHLNDAGKYIFIPVFLCVSLLIYFPIYDVLLHGSLLAREEQEKEIISDLKKFLSQEYKEVGLVFPDEFTFNDMIKQILINENIKFYAKFVPNNNIVVIAKDKNDKEVYKEEIENPIYFNHHFKVN